MRLSGITLKNFKSHKDTTISPKLITILIGPNSSGKSSILQSLMVLKSSLNPSGQTRYPPITKTESFDLGNYQDVVTNRNLDSKMSIKISGDIYVESGLVSKNPTPSHFGYAIEFTENGRNRIQLDCTIDRFSIKYDWKNEPETYATLHTPDNVDFELSAGNFNDINPRMSMVEDRGEFTDNFNRIFQNGDYSQRLLDDYYFVPVNRITTSYGVLLSNRDSDLISTNTEHMMSQMISLLSKNPDLLDKVSNFIKEISGKSIRTRNLDLDSNNSGVTIDYVGQTISNAITNEGTGLNQLVLLLVTLIIAPKNSIIAIEEPEIHLHPRGQSKLAKIILTIAKKENKQIIFTTHSEHMIYPFLASAASKNENSLSITDLAVYYFTLEEKTALTKVENLAVNKNGQLKGGLKGFWDVDLETISEFMENNNE